MAERFDDAVEVARQLWPDLRPAPGLSPEFIQVSIGHLFGEIWTRPQLSVKLRSLITVASLIALGRSSETRIHMRGALSIGWTADELREVIMHLAYYSGYPTALEASHILSDILSETNADPRAAAEA
jgi:4-carboxymuconolactone decarboxylase